jgi:hypothetical protein
MFLSRVYLKNIRCFDEEYNQYKHPFPKSIQLSPDHQTAVDSPFNAVPA